MIEGEYFDELLQWAEDGFVSLCDSTGLYWGPTPRDLFFYRRPSLHLIEFVVFHLFVWVTHFISRGYYTQVVTQKGKDVFHFSWLNKLIGLAYLACWLFQVYLKALRPHPFIQLCWMFMPCHVITVFWIYIFLFTGPKRQNAHYVRYLATLITSFHWGPVSAAMFPDWSDHQFVIESYFFLVHHALLVVTPIYFAVRYGLLRFTPKFLAHATSVATLINVGPYTVISYLSGLNVNYHLYPPPKLMNWGIFKTEYYRFVVIAILVLLTILFRVGIGLVAWPFRKLLAVMASDRSQSGTKKKAS